MAAFTDAWHSVNEGTAALLKAFECYCSVTDVQITSFDTDYATLNVAIRGFIGALDDEDFWDITQGSRENHGRDFVRMVNATALEHPQVHRHGAFFLHSAEDASVWLSNKTELNSEMVQYWTGWKVTNRKKGVTYLKLCSLWNTHGKDMAMNFYEAARLYCAKQACPETWVLNSISEYIAANETRFPEKNFQPPDSMAEFGRMFMADFYISRIFANGDMDDIRIYWASIARVITRVFINSRIWAKPTDPIPYEGQKKKTLDKVKTKMTEQGVEVKYKLMTQIPLHLTDNEAIELLFKKIDLDVKTVKDWATAQCDELWRLRQQRIEYAKIGSPQNGGFGAKSHDELNFADICATFEKDGFRRGEAYLASRYGNQRKKTAAALGLPLAGTLLPFQFLLVIEHPEITESFLNNFRLYDDNGVRSGFVKTNTGFQLIGYKSRRGNELSEQKINLTPNSIRLVEQIISITEPLRTYLKNQGDEQWRELFLTCCLGFGKPSSAPRTQWSATFKKPSLKERVLTQFRAHTKLGEKELERFLLNVSLNSCRASCAVSVYIDTHSVDKMRKALGHYRYNNFLLGHYLPSCILIFFQTRWIRIFQKGLLCVALQASPYLLQVLKFNTIDELHTFLSHHALKDIPSSLSDPDMEEAEVENEGEVHFGLNAGILALLLSLADAVAHSHPESVIKGIARYWAKVTDLIVKNINSGSDPLLKQHLVEGYKNVDTTGMEALIYERA